MAKRISIINFKGGVGKTTLAFHLAAYLANEKRVLLIDVDHQSSLSIMMLGRKSWEMAANTGRTSNAIFEHYCRHNVPMPGTEIITKAPLVSKGHIKHHHYDSLDIVPAQFELDDTEIDMASTTIGSAVYSEWQKRTLVAQWIDNVNANKNYDYIIFDCPPATKLVSQNAIAASQYYFIPVIPDEMSTRGVTHFQTLVKNKIDKKLVFYKQSNGLKRSDIPKSYSQKTKLGGISPFLARIAGRAQSGMINAHTAQINSLRRLWGTMVLDNIVKNYAGVSESLDAGWPVWDQSWRQNVTLTVRNMMTDVCEEIENRV